LVAGQTADFYFSAKDSFGNSNPTGLPSLAQMSVYPADGNDFDNLSSNGSGGYTARIIAKKAAPTQNIWWIVSGVASPCLEHLTVTPGLPASLVLTSAPSTQVAGSAFNINVTAHDSYGNTATGHTGNLTFSSSDGQADLASTGPLSNGTGLFNFNLKTAGSQTITVTDGTRSATSSSIMVTPGPYSVGQSQIILSANSIRSGLSVTASLHAKDAYGNANPTSLPNANEVLFTLSGGGSGTFGQVTGPNDGIYQAQFTGENNSNNGPSIIGATIDGDAVTNTANLTIFSPLAIIPGNFSFPIGRPLVLSFSASGGTPGYTFSIDSGPGHATNSITAGGELDLSLVPRSAGEQTVVRVTDAQNNTSTCTITHV
jgi:hypothetical protein